MCMLLDLMSPQLIIKNLEIKLKCLNIQALNNNIVIHDLWACTYGN